MSDGDSVCDGEGCGWVGSVPPGGKLLGHVWDCGDDWCDCCQAQIEWYRPEAGWKKDLVTVWQGEFYTDGEGWDAVFVDLDRIRQHLDQHHHDLYDRITWAA